MDGCGAGVVNGRYGTPRVVRRDGSRGRVVRLGMGGFEVGVGGWTPGFDGFNETEEGVVRSG